LYNLPPCWISLRNVMLEIPLLAHPLKIIFLNSFSFTINELERKRVRKSYTVIRSMPLQAFNSSYFLFNLLIIIINFNPLFHVNFKVWIYFNKPSLWIKIAFIKLMQSYFNWKTGNIIIADPLYTLAGPIFRFFS